MVSIRPTALLRRRSAYSTSESFRWSSSQDGERQRARADVSRPLGSGPARADLQRRLGVVSIRRHTSRPSAEATTRPADGSAGRVVRTASASELVLTYRDHPATAQRGPSPSVSVEWSRYVRPRSFVAARPTRPASHSAGRVVRTASASEHVLTYRDHPAADQRGPSPSVGVEWSRYVRPRSFVAARPTRPAERSAGRVVRASLRGSDVSRPPGSGSARAEPQRGCGVVSIRPEHARASPLRATRPADGSAGRVVRASSRGSDVSRPPGNGSARATPQRQLGVVSIRRTQARTSPGPTTRPATPTAGRVVRTASASELVLTYRDHPATAQREPAGTPLSTGVFRAGGGCRRGCLGWRHEPHRHPPG
ncbi:hypothetical protein QE370_002394 [Aeromicrobium sp. SORGH_AS981]|nr:hypothetical protein [Aeromicrobium sp. SORGH_AS_0981]